MEEKTQSYKIKYKWMLKLVLGSGSSLAGRY